MLEAPVAQAGQGGTVSWGLLRAVCERCRGAAGGAAVCVGAPPAPWAPAGV